MKWIIKTASLLVMAAAMLMSCQEKVDDGGASVSIPDLAVSFDKNVIRSDGKDFVTLRAYYKGEDVSSKGAVLYQVIPDEVVPQEMKSREFSTTVPGTYTFIVSYNTSISKEVSIDAVDMELPSVTTDKEPSNTSFVRRTFFNQYTGANCGYCPGMIKLLRETLVDDVSDKVVLASLRTYGGESGFANVPNPSSGFPYLHIDYQYTYDYRMSAEGLQEKIENITKDPASVGISANPVYDPETKKIVVRVAVKAAVKNEYNVGLWLMQDGYYKKQKDELGIIGSDTSYNYHNNCVRVANSEYLGSHVGYPLGVLDKGQTGEWLFTFDVDDDSKTGWWVGLKDGVDLNSLHFAAFVTTHEGSQYMVANAIDFKYDESRAFEYCK